MEGFVSLTNMLRRCPVCPNIPGRYPIEPTGPRPCKVLCIGEAGAKNEDRRGYPFAGASGKELDTYYLPRAGLSRDVVGVTNAMKCSLQGYRNPKPEEAAVCAEFHLARELREFDPEVIVPMGAVACSLFEPDVSLELHHGMALVRSLYDWMGIVFPNYHPAAGMRDDLYLTHLHNDFPRLEGILRGEIGADDEPEERPGDYGMCETRRDVREELMRTSPWEIGLDTETIPLGPAPDARRDKPYMLSWSGRRDGGRVIMADRPELLKMFVEWVREKDPLIDVHNALFDMPVTQRMGVPLDWRRIEDTMIDAYHARSLPHGLKALSYRLLKSPMGDYEDLVKPHSLEPQLDWLADVATHEGIEQPWLKPRQWKVGRKAAHAFTAAANKGAYPQERIKNWIKDEERDFWAAEDAVGKFPWMSLRFVPLEQAVYYAAMDAARTLELRPKIGEVLRGMRRNVGA